MADAGAVGTDIALRVVGGGALSWKRQVLACAALGALVACDSGQDIGQGAVADYVLPTGGSWQELRQQADQALERYDQAVAAVGPSRVVTVTPPAYDPTVGVRGMNFDSATVTPSGTRLNLTFIGSPHPAAEPCGTDYSAEAVESAHAVVVIVLAQEHAYDGICTMVGVTRTADVNLARPLDDRAVLDVTTGQPKPVSASLVTD